MLGPVDMSLPFSAQSAHVARAHLVSWMEALDVRGEGRDDARLVLSELVGNAVRHARPLPGQTVRVAWSTGPWGLHISVSDGGARTAPHKTAATARDLSGRGLAIVETLATRWWVETSACRTTVHARVALD